MGEEFTYENGSIVTPETDIELSDGKGVEPSVEAIDEEVDEDDM